MEKDQAHLIKKIAKTNFWGFRANQATNQHGSKMNVGIAVKHHGWWSSVSSPARFKDGATAGVPGRCISTGGRTGFNKHNVVRGWTLGVSTNNMGKLFGTVFWSKQECFSWYDCPIAQSKCSSRNFEDGSLYDFFFAMVVSGSDLQRRVDWQRLAREIIIPNVQMHSASLQLLSSSSGLTSYNFSSPVVLLL